MTEASAAISISVWFCLFMTLFFLVYGISRCRWLLIKPSMVFALFFHVQIQWPSAFYWSRIVQNLTNPFAYFVLSQVFPLLLIMGSLFIGRGLSGEIFTRVIELPRSSYPVAFLLLGPLMLVSLLIMGWYLHTVPWEKTGLYAVIYHPEQAKMAREYSLKLLTSKYLKYAVSVFNSSFAPIMACLLAVISRERWLKGDKIQSLLYLSALIPIIVAVSISGARGPGAMILLATLFLTLLLQGLPLQPLRIAIIAALILILPGLIELLRSGDVFRPDEIAARYAVIVERAVGYGMTVDAQWHIEYATKFGYWGIAGIEKLAPLFGIQPIDIMNVVGRAYTDTSQTTHISANASMIFLYYACFGWWAVPLCLILAWSLDTVLPLYRRMRTIMLPVAIAACGIAAVYLAHTAYTTIFITHGFLVVLMICLLGDRVIWRLRPEPLSR